MALTCLMTDTCVLPADGYVEPDEVGKDDLRKFIRQYVRDRGGYVGDVYEVAKACHKQFPGVFKWSEIERQMERVQSRWDELRAAANPPPPVEPPVESPPEGGGTP